jgi:pimeloyl-ACP methyl ester carboxylesterase
MMTKASHRATATSTHGGRPGHPAAQPSYMGREPTNSLAGRLQTADLLAGIRSCVAHDRHRQAVQLGTGLTVSYVAQGDRSGVPVVLLHAWSESVGCFDRLLPLLPPTIQAVAMDQRGHGEADKPADGYTLVDLADDVAAFMDAVA